VKSFSGPSPAELKTICYCLRFEAPSNLEAQVPVFISPRNRVAQLFPQASFHSQGYDRACLPSPSLSHIATDGQSVCLSWCRAPAGAHDQFFFFFLILKLLSCSFGAPSLTRGRVCQNLGTDRTENTASNSSSIIA
jgi:hypothetical protein